MNEKKEEQNILYQNINLINPSQIKVTNGNKEKNNLFFKKKKNKKQSFINSTNYNLQNTQSNISLNYKYNSILSKRPKNLLKNLSFLNDENNTNNPRKIARKPCICGGFCVTMSEKKSLGVVKTYN